MAAALFTGGTALSEWGLGSISEELTQEAARAYVLAQVNQAVEEALAQPRPFVTIERDGEGEPVAVQADTAALNELRLQVLGTLEESLNGSVTVEVPVGSLTEVALLNGRGFPVPLTLGMEGSADLSFQTEFVSAGINQSCHRVTMVVKAQGFSQSRRFETQVEVETSTVLAETVLVGAVPEGAVLQTG
ncbi:MAG TPA: sporulation protein YunB [Candidatus Acutalibacter ornithocaccae]|uniref:Sporulation protein YunB n=1 Tax=Candidatus Acutalibacter ornithocaccae TaxID=2838416 RepID=A0A9D2RZZ6_9FIRM|nr:sporulation protein YunB [Candidatus Acutalibacter ornithocaccae]